MALFDVRRLDSLFHKPQQPTAQAPEDHTKAPVSHTPAPVTAKPAPAAVDHAPVPKAAPVPAAHDAIPKAVPVVDKAPSADPAKAPAQAGTDSGTKAPLSEAEQHAQVTHQVDELKEKKTIMKPGQKGPEVVILQQQLKQLGLHVEPTGELDKSTEGYIMAIQTGGGLGADGIVGPKTLDQLQKLDQAPTKPAPGKQQDDAKGDGADNVDHMPDDPKLAAVYLFNRQRGKNATETLNPQQQKDMEQFIKNWDSNKARYEEVASKSGVPAKLVASLHWRESTGDFGTYLHQGDPLGKKAVHEPNFDQGVPIFKEWEPAAEHALGMKERTRNAYKIDENTTDEAALASYAERYNGLGYHNYHAMASPYVFAGTDQYSKGKYRSDGAGGWDPNYKDTQLGVLSMMRGIDKHEHDLAEQAAKEKKLAAPPVPAADQHGDNAAPPNLHFSQ